MKPMRLHRPYVPTSDCGKPQPTSSRGEAVVGDGALDVPPPLL